MMRLKIGVVVAAVAFWGFSAERARADSVELLSGIKIEGRILARDAKAVTIEMAVNGQPTKRTFPLDRVSAVTAGGQRVVINERKTTPSESKPTGAKPKTGNAATRSKAEIDALIDQQGKTPPDWFEAAPLNYPKTLDLSWPQPPPTKEWNARLNLGQYIWEVINPNPQRWHEGIKLMHHVLELNKGNADVRNRAMNELGRMYFTLLQDYPRAAFWWRKGGADKGDSHAANQGVMLAECYFRMGNRQMAIDLLTKLPPSYGMIKLWASLGETKKALDMAQANIRGPFADMAMIYAGDACRVAGRHKEAIQFYQQILGLKATGQAKGRIERNQRRAIANIEAIKLFELLDVTKVPDGAYHSASPGYETDVDVEVVVKSNRIESVKVTKHKEKQFFSSMIDVPRKIVEQQSVKGIDATSGATITSEAIINATAKALSAAMTKG